MDLTRYIRPFRTIMIIFLIASMAVGAISQLFHKKHKIYVDPDSDLGKLYKMNFEAEALLRVAQKIADYFHNKHLELKDIYHSDGSDSTTLNKTFQELVYEQMPSAKEAVWSVKFSDPEFDFGTEPYTCLATMFYKSDSFIGTYPELLTNGTDIFKANPQEAFQLAIRTGLGLEPEQYDHTDYEDEYNETEEDVKEKEKEKEKENTIDK